jgi:hypothetical protein
MGYRTPVSATLFSLGT